MLELGGGAWRAGEFREDWTRGGELPVGGVRTGVSEKSFKRKIA